ncbi:hypothetical protein Q9966_016332 [Columba livia]|nr:hypothetical protein Q9966_016332 [Columba livia]
MSEVQGTVEFSVELHKFHNVDLFQRGQRNILGIPRNLPLTLESVGVGKRKAFISHTQTMNKVTGLSRSFLCDAHVFCVKAQQQTTASLQKLAALQAIKAPALGSLQHSDNFTNEQPLHLLLCSPQGLLPFYAYQELLRRLKAEVTMKERYKLIGSRMDMFNPADQFIHSLAIV